ncbi:hypothetical protein BgiMline_000334 [Biomphalaria glabrata]|uniref:Uncharacterized protein LOC106063301 n=1 Tax=Biomphalaria glabrata TaxID=6526 RepID=A0A9W2ZGF6_BIOGL|nr:uncharacterized protein LOC106063301 [Biomphalaria glabrata]XP_055874034.1 uncharacterized protein LOC106063301 [Biomphalaria glabrata]XP_055874035.1 uncharacterized protein LOC106063301 [Biomphalaria glabrata]KAI8768292.1 hypothetical protein BgiMline_000315 [Biomphalaria glabrata]KAI8777451.1 hypothetical protein BgiBS90_021654 [Biomphalaria glabrata]
MDFKTPVRDRGCRDFSDAITRSNSNQDMLIDPITPKQRSNISLKTPSFMYIASNCQVKGSRKSVSDQDCPDLSDKTSPGLTRLRMTPGFMREKQKNLIDQHREILQKGSHVQAGGGISIWPEMHAMRLTRSEVILLLVQAIILCGLTLALLNKLHGQTFSYLKLFSMDVKKFCSLNYINESQNQEIFQSQVIQWHNDFYQLTETIQVHFDLTSMSTSYQVYISTYILGLLVLLYYLMDNMLARNKLTPSRVKKWTCLLVVIGSWTCSMAYGLFLASQLERQMVLCVQQLSSFLGTLVISPLDLDTFQAVLLYWKTRFLDSTSMGILNLFGLIPIRDLLYYLQYYSVPIATVLLSPVLQLCCSCLAVYSQGEYMKPNS